MSTTFPKTENAQRQWYLVDATNIPVGRLAVVIADTLRGKRKPDFAPHVDTGDFVIVVNSAKVALTGNKENTKVYKSYSGFPGGRIDYVAKDLRVRNPDRMVEDAVWGMLPKRRLGRQQYTRLKVYPTAEHPHKAQEPKALEIKS
jgi:large subunit ribosomal protein L13